MYIMGKLFKLNNLHLFETIGLSFKYQLSFTKNMKYFLLNRKKVKMLFSKKNMEITEIIIKSVLL